MELDVQSVVWQQGGSLTIVNPLDYARGHLASDAGSGKKTFDGLFDCLSFCAVPKDVNAVVAIEQDKAHHSVCRLVDRGVRFSVSFACGGLWPL